MTPGRAGNHRTGPCFSGGGGRWHRFPPRSHAARAVTGPTRRDHVNTGRSDGQVTARRRTAGRPGQDGEPVTAAAATTRRRAAAARRVHGTSPGEGKPGR
jgi:hypothetical protein